MTSNGDGDYIIMSKSEKLVRESAIFFSVDEIEALIENKDTVKKFLTKTIHKIQADLWNLNYVGTEWEAYANIKGIREIINGLDSTLDMYKEHIRKEKEEQEKKEQKKNNK